jgi:hypothetical protein
MHALIAVCIIPVMFVQELVVYAVVSLPLSLHLDALAVAFSTVVNNQHKTFTANKNSASMYSREISELPQSVKIRNWQRARMSTLSITQTLQHTSTT